MTERLFWGLVRPVLGTNENSILAHCYVRVETVSPDTKVQSICGKRFALLRNIVVVSPWPTDCQECLKLERYSQFERAVHRLLAD